MNAINGHRTCTWDKDETGSFLHKESSEQLYKTYAPFLDCLWKDGYLWARCKIRSGQAAW